MPKLSYDLAESSLSSGENPESTLLDINETANNTQKYDKILKALIENNLTEKQKCYIILYYRDNLTIKEIAARFGVAPSTVSRTVKRGKRRLAGAIKRESLKKLFSE